MTTSRSTSNDSPSHSSASGDTGERAELVEVLRRHRGLFRRTVTGLTDEQARLTPTASSLSLGGLVKHVAATEQEWARFIVEGAAKTPDVDWANVDWSNPPPEIEQYANGFRMLEGEDLAGVLSHYEDVAAATDELVLKVDLDARQLLPEAPWFEPGSSWSARRVFMHILAETTQHAGHADILRETIDGQKTMG
jgi:uncharacterized damage-inducible protein DinB